MTDVKNNAHKPHMTGAEQDAEETSATLPKGETWEDPFWSASRKESTGSWWGRPARHHCRPTPVGTGIYITKYRSQRSSVFLRQDGENQIHKARPFSTRKEAQTETIQKQLQPPQEVQNPGTCPLSQKNR